MLHNGQRLFRWLDAQGTCGIDADFNVLDYGRTDLYGHLLGIFAKLDIFKAIGATPSQMLDFFIDVDATYLNAPYHSFYHAVDIVTVLYYILTELAADHYLSEMDVASLMIAALCHDAGHVSFCFFLLYLCVRVCVRLFAGRDTNKESSLFPSDKGGASTCRGRKRSTNCHIGRCALPLAILT